MGDQEYSFCNVHRVNVHRVRPIFKYNLELSVASDKKGLGMKRWEKDLARGGHDSVQSRFAQRRLLDQQDSYHGEDHTEDRHRKEQAPQFAIVGRERHDTG
jgi:hypothetical protein